ncbi:Ig-like domain-containing protein [Cytobacillus praedii]|uniref:Ig-like domain-containing protein n=1 Tax=Cytobacillus praedii TaxID=1742358 RepID=UPI002E22AB4A|nr:Ig-like domain-containing protein [Cytobacillus praedii]
MKINHPSRKKKISQATALASIATVAAVLPVEEIPIFSHFIPDGVNVVNASGAVLKDTKVGDIIYFAKQEWIVLNPETGFIILKGSFKWSGDTIDFSWKGNSLYDPKDTYNNLGYMLNEMFTRSFFSDEDLNKVKTVNWTVGPEGNESSKVISAKIGVLSVSEWEKYRPLIGDKIVPDSFWTRTPTGGNVFVANKNGNWNMFHPTSKSYAVPVLYLNPDTVLPENIPPSIKLTRNTNELSEEVEITADITDDSEITVKKWAIGTQNAAYFATNGTVFDRTFKATSNSIYTVFAKDVHGNESVQTITINNVNMVGKEVNINSLDAGDVIKIGNRDWLVLNPSTGFIIAKAPLYKNWSFGSSNFFNLSEGVGYLLNNESLWGGFMEKFTASEKAKIKTTAWEIGPRGKEATRKVNAKVGLLTAAQWENYSEFFNPDSGVLETDDYTGMWTITSDTNNTVIPVGYYSKVDASSGQYPTDSFNVVPALYLNTGSTVTFVSKKKEKEVYQNPDYTHEIESMEAGDVVEFGEKRWIVLDPSKRFLLSEYLFYGGIERPGQFSYYKAPQLYGPGYFSTEYSEDSSGLENPGYSLYTRFAKNMGPYFSQITNTVWETTQYKNDTWTPLPTKPSRFGLLSSDELRQYARVINKISPEKQGFWLRDVVDYTVYGTRYIGSRHFPIDPSYVENGRVDTATGIRPAIYLEPHTKVKPLMVANQAPTINLLNDTELLVNGSQQIKINGNTTDLDGDNITVSATIDGKTKTLEISGDGEFELTWDVADINDGTYENISVTAEDNKGGKNTATYTSKIIVDKTAPSTATFAASTTLPTNQAVIITITYPSDADTKEYKVGENGNWLEYTGPVQLKTNNTVYARSKDHAGNWSEEAKFEVYNIDLEAPSIPVFTLDNSSATNNDVVVTIQYSKDTTIKEYRINGGEWTPYTKPLTVTENSRVEARATDAAGNISEIGSIDVSNIDKTKPEITLTPSRIDPVNTEIDVDVEVIDNNPIVMKKWAKGNQDTSYFQTGGTDVVDNKFIVSENGIYTVYAKDAAGNETIETIEINNIDMDAPDVAQIKTSTTVPTNKDVTVTITYPDDVTVKEYRIGTGKWTSYEGPFTVSSNVTVYARGKDAAGNWSEESSFVISNIDKIAPLISITGIINGKTYVNEVKPLVSVEDLNKVTTTILLNGKEYDGSIVTESGSYILTVKAVDEAGNESTETIAFHVNHSPEIIGSISGKKWKKFEEETIDLSTIFSDKEDKLSYTVTSSDENSVSVIVKDGSLHVKALKQGSATITVVANDGFSDSETITFKVDVNSVAPTVSLTNEQTWFTADGEKFKLEGIIKDEDKEEVVITVTINGVEKSLSILTTGGEDTWSIEFDGADIATGVHTVSIQAKDAFDGSAVLEGSKYVIKVPVSLGDYEPILSGYEKDIKKDRQDFTESEHKVLLDAFVAVESLKTTNKPDAWLSVKPKVDLLADGTVKAAFYKAISGNALDYLVDNFDTATKSDYETAGFENIKDSLVPTYNEKNKDYLAEKDDLTKEDIQLIINIVNAVDKATSSNLVEDWKAAKIEIEKLDDGLLKNEYLQVVEDGFVKAIEVNPHELTSKLVGEELGLTATLEHEVDYQMYLQDELAVDPVLTKERLEKIIQTVDKMYDLLDSFMEQPTQQNLTSFENAKDALTSGNYQSKNEGFLPGMNLEMIVNDPSSMSEAALNTIGITHDVSHLPLYQDFLTDYLVDVAKRDITKEVLQRIIDVVDAIERVKENPSDENIQDLIDLIGGLNPDASVIDEILDEVGGSILDKINEDFTNVTEKQLENIGIDNIDSSRMPEYQDALNEYAKEKDPADLTREDIQNVIDAINGVEDAKANPSEETIRDGYDAVNQLDDGPLKDKLLQELEDIAVDYIANNPDKITQDLLDYANLVTNPDLIDSYKDYLKDVLPGLSDDITKEKLQELINQVNEVWAAYHEAMNNPSKVNVLAYEELANGLVDGVFKTKMVGLVDDVALALAYLKVSPNTQESDDYARMGMTIVEENISSYNTNMEKYLKDIGAENFTLSEVEQVITVTNKVETALADSKTANVQQALSEVRNLQNGKLKSDLTAALNGQVIGDINLNPGTVTADDLINLGIENVNPDYEELYRDALTKLKDDLGGTLTFEDVQNAVDSVNAVEKALESGDNKDIVDSFEKIKQLPDGSLKDYLTEKLQEEVIKEIIENPENITTDHLENGGFTDVDSSLEDEYKDALTGYKQPLTEEAVQQIIDVVNQVKKTRLDLTQNDVNSLSEMVDRLAESDTKSNLIKVKDALKALLNAEQYMNVENLRAAFDKIALVDTREKAYLTQMATALSQVRSALVDPSDETVGLAQAELVKLDNGLLKERMQSRVGGAYLEHVITDPGSSSHSDWINAGFENVIEDNLPAYKDAVGSISNEVGQLTKEQIQAIVDAINAMQKAKEKPTNQTIQDAKAAINKVVESQLKKNWLAEMDALWQSIQPKPTPKPEPEPIKPPVKPEPLPQPSDKVMVVSNEYASIVMTIPQIEVAQTDSLKVKIKVSAKDILEGSKLYLYANSATLRGLGGTAVAGTSLKYMNVVGQKGYMLEIDFGKLEKGTIEVDRDLVFDENGEYLLKGVFVANGTNLETNTVKVSVYNDLLIPNTALPNPHGLPVATLKANQDIALYKLDKNGNFVRVSGAKAGTLHHVYDTEKGYYKLADGYYVQPSQAVTVHIGKGEVRKDEVNVYDKNGRFIRTIKKGQQYKVYSYDNKRYAIGGGEYIEVQDGVTYVFGWITVKEPMTLYKPDGTVERTLKVEEKYRVYRADGDVLHLGGGYKVKRANSKYEFLKN